MALSRRNGRTRATLAFLILISVTAITLDFRDDEGGVIGTVRDVASDVFSPVRDAASSVLSPVGDALNGVTGYGDVEDENAELRERIAELEGNQLQSERATDELRELLALNGLDDVLGAPTVAARVVAAPVSNFEETIELNRGTAQGIAVDMPVVTGTGLVGRVVQVSGSRSVVRLITDPASSVGVRFASTGEVGIAEGRGPDRTLGVGFVEVGATLGRRELAVTSGLEGGSDVYPPGIPVGRVVSAETPPGELEQRIELRPVADLGHLRYVKVVLA